MTNRPTFNMRLRAYTPLGAPGAVIPDQGITLVSGPDGPNLTAIVNTTVYGSLPDDLEVAVEVWADSVGVWTEGRDSRFVITSQQHDDRDRTGTVTLQGVGLAQFLMMKAALAGVVPYSDAGNVEAAASSSTVHVTGKTFTWASHILGEGDRVRVVKAGGAKDLSTGAAYFVRNPSGSTFQVSVTPTGAIRSFGSSTKVSMERVRTRIVNLNGHKFGKNMAVSVIDAAGSNLTDGSVYYVVNPTASTVQLATKPGGIPEELNANALTVYRYLDGPRLFQNMTPGEVLGDPFLEARDRGWGCDSSGNPQVGHTWTNAGDSNSMAWPARVDDPTITGVSVGFQPGTSLWDMCLFLVDNGWAEFASHARNFDLFAPNTGTDFGTTANQRRIGSVAQQVQVTKDLSEYRTAEVVRGEGPIEQTVTDHRSPWGRLEVYATASGTTTNKHARSYGNTDLSKYNGAAVGYQVTEAAQEAPYLPIFDYQRGDWVMVQVKGAWARLRVTQWTLTKNTDGTATVTTLLEKRKRSVLHKVAHASKKANGGRAATSTTTTPGESDARKAAQPGNLTLSARTTHNSDGSSKSTVTAKWLPVTTDFVGDDLTGAAYEVLVRTEGEQVGKSVAVTKGIQADLSGYSAGQVIAVSVRAQSSTGTWGELSPELEYTVDGPENLPDTPTTPIAASSLGSVTVGWDGLVVDPIDGPIAPPAGFAYVLVQRSSDNGTTWVTETQQLRAAGSVTDLGLVVNAPYSYRLVAVDTLGNQSAPSWVASVSVVGIDVAQINAGFKASMDQVAATATNAQTVANQSAATAGTALTTANSASTTASNAQSTADGKNTVTYSTAAAASTTPGKVAGDQWFQIDASGRITAQWTWTVTNGAGAWTSTVLTGSVITNLDAGSITTGTLASEHIGARSITVEQLSVAALQKNSVANGSFEDGLAGWVMGENGGSVTVVTGDSYTGSQCVALYRSGVSSPNVQVWQDSANAINVVPGDQWLVTAWAKTSNGASFYVRVFFYDRTGAQLSNYDTAGGVFPGTGWSRYGGSVTVPVNAATMRISHYNTQPNTTVYVDESTAQRRTPGELIVDGAISAQHIAATAIDGKTITGATIRTASTAQTSGGVILDNTGITGYNASGAATFRVDNAGNTTMTGTVNATGGSISGQLNIGSTGSIVSATSWGNVTMAQVGFHAQSPYYDSTLTDSGLQVNANGVEMLSVGPGAISNPNGGLTFTVSGPGKTNWPSTEDFAITNDGSPRVYSYSIFNRSYAGVSATPNAQSSSSTGFVVISSQGTLGVSYGYVQIPDAYSRVETARAVYINSSGTLGTTSSARATKDLWTQITFDDTELERWVSAAPTWAFNYKTDDSKQLQVGVVAEEMLDAGYGELIYYNEQDTDPETGRVKGQVDGFAYERMGVYNRLAIGRLLQRIQAIETRLSDAVPSPA